jgi:hypothetical protein
LPFGPIDCQIYLLADCGFGCFGASISIKENPRLVALANSDVIPASERGNKVMPSKLAETTRNFNPMLAPGLSDEARKAVKAAFDAMSTWRTDIVNDNEKNLERVIDKIAAAARALGWPEEIADTTRAQMQTINKMQLQMMDYMMDAWEGQLSSPNSSSSILSKLRSSPPLSPAGSWPFAATSQMAGPFGVYMQIAQQWQKTWADAMASWIKTGRPN